MDSFSGAALLVLGIIVYSNFANGTLGDWFRAKFLGRSTVSSSAATAPAIPTTSNGAHVPPHARRGAWRLGELLT